MSNFRPISIPRNPERKNIDPEETSRYICSETLLLHFSVAGAVPPQRTTERLASSNRDSEGPYWTLGGGVTRPRSQVGRRKRVLCYCGTVLAGLVGSRRVDGSYERGDCCPTDSTDQFGACASQLGDCCPVSVCISTHPLRSFTHPYHSPVNTHQSGDQDSRQESC